MCHVLAAQCWQFLRASSYTVSANATNAGSSDDADVPGWADPPCPLLAVALLALVLYPVVCLILLPFRLARYAVHGALELVRAVILLPVRVARLER